MLQWSDKIKGKENEVTKKFDSLRKKMKAEPAVSISDMLAARKNLAIVEKTSSASVRKKTQTSLNKVIIGKVGIFKNKHFSSDITLFFISCMC